MSRARRRRSRSGAALPWFLLLCASCARLPGGCSGEPSLAELIEVHGRGVQRDFEGRVGQWQAASVGARFALGDGVRAGADAHALLQLQDGSAVRLRPGSMLRFLASAQGAEHGLDVQVGEAEISVGAVAMRLRTGLGVAVLEPGSRVALRRSGADRIVYRVELGSARLQSAHSAPQLVQRGEVVEVGIGMAILDRPPAPEVAVSMAAAKPAPEPVAPPPVEPPPAEPPPAEPPPAEPAPAAAVDTKATPAPPSGPRADTIAVGPERVSVGAAAGESFSVHAARLPVAVAFAAGERCPGEVVLVLDGKPRARGKGQVSAAVGGGHHPYELRCVQSDGSVAADGVASGSVTALRDSGSARLPRRAPTSYVDADGKRYTVLFQNLLPRIELSWPNAPKSDGYSVHVESGGKQRTLQTNKPEYEFASGTLGEGTHRLHFTTPAAASSKTTTLEIRFDNAAPKASVTRPRDGSFAPGASVEVTGVALPGYQVSLPGGTIELDGQYRFKGAAVTTHGQPDVALRIESPRGGVHYYVRRAAAAP